MRRWIQTNPATAILMAATCGAVLVASAALYRGEDTRGLIVKSPCLDAPASEACQRSKRESDRRQSVADACITFRKVGYVPCPTGAAVNSKRTPNVSKDLDLDSGGNAFQPVQAGQPSKPPKGGGVGTGEGTPGGTKQPPKPQQPTPAANPQPDPTDIPVDTSPAPVVPSPPATTPPPPPPSLSGGIKEVLDGVTNPVCAVTQPLTGICLR